MNEHERVLCGQQLERNLTLQIDQVSSYTDYLAGIKRAISKNDIQKLDDLLKNQQLNPEIIEQTQQQQAKILSQYGFEISNKGLSSCNEGCHNTTQLQALNGSLNNKLKELEKALMVNALLVKKGQHRVKQSIRILSGHNLTSSASSYTRQGSINDHEESKHSLAQA